MENAGFFGDVAAGMPELPLEGGGDADEEGGQLEQPAGAPRGEARTTTVEPGRSQPLLIYAARLQLAVFEVAPTQRAALKLAKQLGGFLSSQGDRALTVRVPASKFEEAVRRLEALGDVLHRDIQGLDVTEEFRDLTLRLRNSEAVRNRLEKLLERANKVEDALKVQTELARVTESIESMKGRLRFLEDRIAYSTITLDFQPRPRQALGQPDTFRLPFPWLDRLGLQNLLQLG